MANESVNPTHLEQPDPAAIFACAHSLWEAGESSLELSETFNGVDGFMRAILRAGELFEKWACQHVFFDEMNECWPYFLQDRFGNACFEIMKPNALESFDEKDCLRVALHLNFPLRLDTKQAVPVDFTSVNPNAVVGFLEFRIQSVRHSLTENDVTPFGWDDEPFDEEFSEPFFALYGIAKDGLLEHIADRKTYGEALRLVQKLAPGIVFPNFTVRQ